METIASGDGTKLVVRANRGLDSRGVLIVAHGLGEHAGCYDHVAHALTTVPGLVDVLAFDFRGHGRSAGRRGVVREYEDLVHDLRAVLAWAARERPGVPRFVLGHSNGGLVALLTVLGGGVDDLSGLILSNPALRLLAPVPSLKRRAGVILRRIAPGLTLRATVAAERMTRDIESLNQRRVDPLRHDRICAPLFFGIEEGGSLALASAAAIQTPTLMLLGGADAVVDPQASQELFHRLSSADKTLHLYPEMRHEPLNELGREQVLDDLVSWLTAHLDALALTPGGPSVPETTGG